MYKSGLDTAFITIERAELIDDSGNKILDVPINTLLHGQYEVVINGYEYQRVRYRDHSGYIYVGELDEYVNEYAQNVLDLSDVQTADPFDPPQFYNWKNTSGKSIVCKNGCGPLCVTAAVGGKFSENLLKWKENSAWYYSHVFQKDDKDRGTNEDALLDMLSCLGVTGAMKFDEFFTDMKLERSHVTAVRMQKALITHHVIYGVSINQVDGRLVTNKAIPHWILLEKMKVNGTNGIVEHYNPFYNGYNAEAWNYMRLSAIAIGEIGGILIPRKGAEKHKAALKYKNK